MSNEKIKKLRENIIPFMKRIIKKKAFYIGIILAAFIYYVFRKNLHEVFLTDLIDFIESLKSGDVKFFEPFKLEEVEKFDDQRSTIWPVLISLAVTLLGSLITTYVFLKGALDRTVDEKPHYEAVIKKYRENTMKHLWYYSIFSLFLMALVVSFYFLFYFFNKRILKLGRGLIIILYGICMIISVEFLHRCIDTNKGMQKAVKKILSEKRKDGKSVLREIKKPSLYDMKEKELSEKSIEEWLEINDGIRRNMIDKRKFINRFSEWEKILLLLIEKNVSIYREQSVEERIKNAVLDGEKVFEKTDIENDDASAYHWEKDSYIIVKEHQDNLKISGEQFCNIYELLAEYRDLLKVQLEMNEEEGKSDDSNVKEENIEFAELFFIFLMYLWVNIFRMIPKITVFFPAGRFLYMNFYNTRFEDSAFRASSFENGIFSRSKIENSNFGMALFRNCEFFSVDSRDCSFSNTLLEKCGLREAIFKNVDFTGAVFEDCKLEKAVFNDSILSNLRIKNVSFEENEFINSKIRNVTLSLDLNREEGKLSKCNFSESNIYDIRLNVEKNLIQPVSEEKDDLIIKEYMRILGNGNMDRYFWEDGEDKGNENLKLREWIDDFELYNVSFYELTIIEGTGQKKTEAKRFNMGVDKKETAINMNESGFINTMMPGIEFYRVRLEQSIFSNAQMEGAKFISVYMPGCIMNYANMRKGLFWAVNMKSAVLNDTILFKAKCKLTNIEDASLRSLHASGTEIMYCTFNRSDCSNIDLTKADVKETFMDAILKEAEFTKAKFHHVSFENSIADNMLSSYSIFEGCIMKNAFLQQSSFNYTVFIGCDFSYANFANSAVTNVEFRNCDFKESNFRNTCFINACFEDNCHIKKEYFKGCQFINTQFKGRNKIIKKWLNLE